ncbi:MAG: UvrB/UvrC motif-containing protein [Clostridia bacterium]|nr:UvrB/UvrC motif-containing protein [Clostridia bacterium]
MICEKCKKNNATAHLHSVSNGIVKDAYLCSECANAYKVAKFDNGDLFDIMQSFLNDTARVKNNIKCDSCGITFQEVKANGRLGCANCYSAFENQLSDTILKLHGSTVHKGKRPYNDAKNYDVTSESDDKYDLISDLKQKLKMAVENEQYEQAAVLRDEIKRLEE